MNKTMKELEAFKAKRAVQLDENTKAIEGLTAEIELTKKAALDATSAGNTTAYAAALDKRTELERKLEVMREFRRTALENYTTGTDPVVMKIAEKMLEEHDKLIAPKIKQLIKMSGDLCAAYIEVLQIQADAITERGEIARCFSKESGIDALNARRTLPFTTSFDPVGWEVFRKFFSEEMQGHDSVKSPYYRLFAITRNNL